MKALFLATSAMAVAASLAVPASADELPGYAPPHVLEYSGGRIPEYAHLEERTNMKLIAPGLVIAGVPYGFSLLYALSTCGAQMECRSGSAWLYMPVLGPFLTAAQAPTTGGQALSVFDGALQTVGLGIAIAGFLMPRQVVVWQDREAAVRVTPTLLPGGGGGLSMTLTSM